MKKVSLFWLTIIIVGFCGSTLASDKMVNIRVSPIVLAIGALNLEADIKVTDNITVGPMYTSWNISDSDTDTDFSVSAYGVRADWYKNGAFNQGNYWGIFLKKWSLTISETDLSGTYKGSVDINVVGAVAGYRWMWDAFNVNTELGYAIGSAGDIKLTDSSGNTKEYSDSGTSGTIGGLVIDFSIGWAF